MSNGMHGGYTGKIMRVDLTENRVSEESTDEELCRKYIGGAGFVSYYLWKELGAQVNPQYFAS